MDAGGLAQMSHSTFNTANGLPSGGLASRRGGQSLKPLSFDALKSPTDVKDNGAPTPRTSRSHLLAGLRTAPKSATAATFPTHPASPTTAGPRANRSSMGPGMLDSLMNGPRTSVPQYGRPQLPAYQPPVTQPMGYPSPAHYTTEQILAPPQLQFDEHGQENIDPSMHAQLMMANAYLTDQQQRLQQQLRDLQAAAQQFQGLNINGHMQMQQSYNNLYQQQLQLQQMMAPAMTQPNIYSVYDPVTGQQTLYVDQSQAQANLLNQAQFGNNFASMAQQTMGAPRLQVSPPPEVGKQGFRNPSPPRRYESPVENPTLPPPSANAFRRGHKKSNSLVNRGPLSIATSEQQPLRSAGPKTASFPLTPAANNGYAPGQARAGEHPIRQPHNPPSIDELKAKPTSKHEGSKNFAARTRRSALRNIVRAGLERRKEARSSGSISPISESTEETVETPMTDNDSDSGRSGSGSLVDHDDAECSLPSSRTSTGSWGAIGSDRPSSRQKADRNDSNNSDVESSSESGSFASLLKNGTRGLKSQPVDGRKAAMLVLTSAEKRKAI
ncbi:hypothetical protein GQ53DRAFT_16584 [Thozetella sp. PMI_491]|nr:hypothetical protein GQ53DRAFT_16584 [Thozetella sp. PMI_491]